MKYKTNIIRQFEHSRKLPVNDFIVVPAERLEAVTRPSGDVAKDNNLFKGEVKS